MNLAQINPALPGYGAPLGSVEGKDELTEFLDAQGVPTCVLDAASSCVPGYLGDVRTFRTDDGYLWRRGYRFAADGGEIAILIPWSGDLNCTDEGRIPRAISIYAKGGVTPADSSTILQRFAEEVKTEYMSWQLSEVG